MTKQTTLTRGYVKQRVDDSTFKVMEILFAVYPDGRVLEAEECERNYGFREGRVWKNSDRAHADILADKDIEFIGNYAMPA